MKRLSQLLLMMLEPHVHWTAEARVEWAFRLLLQKTGVAVSGPTTAV